MPTRLLREGALDSDKLAKVSFGAEVLFYRLLLVADDYGRFDGRVSVIRSRCFPIRGDVHDEHVAGWCSELFNARLVHGYVVNEKPYLEIPNFHQRTRAQRSKFPSIEDAGGAVTDIWRSHDGRLALVAPLSESASDSEYVSVSDSVRPCLSPAGHGTDKGPAGDGQMTVTSQTPKPEIERGVRLTGHLIGAGLAQAGDDYSVVACPVEWKAFCMTQRPDLNPETTWANFRDHWLGVPGRDGVKIDWPATWRKWVRKEGTPRGARPGAQAALEAKNRATAERWTPPEEREVTP